MALTTAIEWSDSTFNPWIGCAKVDDMCRFCYAATLNERRKWVGTTGDNGEMKAEWRVGVPRHRTAPSTWQQVNRWNNHFANLPRRHRVFGDSLCDWLDDEVPIEWLVDYLRLIMTSANLDFLLVTKRIQNFYDRIGRSIEFLRTFAPDDPLKLALERWLMRADPLPNVHIGLSVGTRKMLDHLKFFQKVPAAVHFLSMEPLLENVVAFDQADGVPCRYDYSAPGDDCVFDFDNIDGVIVGGESGQSDEAVRPMHPWHVNRISRAVTLYNTLFDGVRPPVTFFFKQWGDYLPVSEWLLRGHTVPRSTPRAWVHFDGTVTTGDTRPNERAIEVIRIGKLRAGRSINGREYDDLPTAEYVADQYAARETEVNAYV